MPRIADILEPGERVVLRHWPVRLAYGLAGAVAALDAGFFLVVYWYLKRIDAMGERELAVAILVAAVIVLALAPLFILAARHAAHDLDFPARGKAAARVLAAIEGAAAGAA